MPDSPETRPRKAPRQARAVATREVILEAAERILDREGPDALNTNRIAEVAGVSIGSLYQYFPNKAAILYRIQADENTDTLEFITSLLGNEGLAPPDRIRMAVLGFFETEVEEAAARKAIADANVDYHESDAYRAIEEAGVALRDAFVRQHAGESATNPRFTAEFVYTTVTGMAETISSRGLTRDEIETWAGACGDMIVRYLRLEEE